MSYRSRTRTRAGAGVSPYQSFISGSLLLSLLALAGCETASTKPLFDDDVPASLQISMARAEVDRGDTVRVEAVLLNRGGAPIGSPSAGAPRAPAPVSWASSDPSVAAISRSGLVSAHRGGEVTITATSGALTSVSRLKVQPRGKLLTISPKVDTLDVGHSLQLSATALNSANTEIPSTLLTWTSLQPSVAEVNARGLVKAVAMGTALIVASAHGYADTARVVVGARTAWTLPIPAIGVVEVTPGEAAVDLGATRQLEVTVKDGSGSPVSGVVPVWSSSDPAVAAVDGKGLVTSRAVGVATIRATVLGISGGAAVTVSNPAPPPPVVTTIQVAPATATVEQGRDLQLSATVRDQNGDPMPDVAVTWSSSNAAVATVDASGRVAAVGQGIASIRASAQEGSGFAAVTVVPAPTPAPPAPPAPPPGAGQFPNEPAGFARITEHLGNPWPSDWWKHDGGNISAEVVPGQPTETPSVRYRLPVGLQGGVGPGMMGHGWQNVGEPGNIRVNGQPTRDLYIAFWYRLAPNWHQPASGQSKLFYVYALTPESRWHIFPLLTGPALQPGAGPHYLGIANLHNPQLGSQQLPANVNNVPLQPGQWYFLEFHFRNASTPGAGDGLIRWWVDGMLAGNYPGVGRPAIPFTEVHWNPVWGGGGGAVLQETYAWYHRIYVSGR
jgi:uncharacterized protein YjdB